MEEVPNWEDSNYLVGRAQRLGRTKPLQITLMKRIPPATKRVSLTALAPSLKAVLKAMKKNKSPARILIHTDNPDAVDAALRQRKHKGLKHTVYTVTCEMEHSKRLVELWVTKY